ncbi:hypothetical protein K439DRAFT_1624369 [Ramaria rubella]|nr:hypothetical protein K439DRAFT_1624369 [Ramaria rubella]
MPLDIHTNPFMVQMRQKIKAVKPCNHGKNLSHVDWRAAAHTLALRSASIWEDLQDHWQHVDTLVKELAKKHGKNECWMAQAINRTSKYGKQRQISKYNAWIHAESLIINEELPLGQKTHLQDFQKVALGAPSHHDVPDHEMSDMVASLEEKGLRERKGIRSCSMAHTHDVGTTTARIRTELKDLGTHCGTSSLAMTVHMEAAQSNVPIIYHDEIPCIAKNSNECKTMMKHLVCTMVKCGLHGYLLIENTDKITGDSGLVMEWKWYETKIVNEHQVELVRWPVQKFDPHVLGIEDLELCMQALSGSAPICFWHKLSSDKRMGRQNSLAEKKASGEIIMKQWKKRSDAGKKRGLYHGKGKKQAQEDDSDKENEGYTRQLKKTCSASIINSDSDKKKLDLFFDFFVVAITFGNGERV